MRNRGMTMKLQATLIAASIAMAMSTSALAQSHPGGPQASQASPGGNTNPHVNFQNSRDAIDDMAGYNGNPLNASESFIYQDGNGNDSDVTQYGEQWSDISQVGDLNDARVQQDDVVGGTGTGENESIISQRGFDNDAQVDQLGERNDSTVTQNGAFNDADVDQQGLLNDSYILQVGWVNDADVEQVGDELDSDIIQRGDWNDADVVQSGYGHDSYIGQWGNGNTATHTQSGSTQHFAESRQYGNGNVASVVQAP